MQLELYHRKTDHFLLIVALFSVRKHKCWSLLVAGFLSSRSNLWQSSFVEHCYKGIGSCCNCLWWSLLGLLYFCGDLQHLQHFVSQFFLCFVCRPSLCFVVSAIELAAPLSLVFLAFFSLSFSQSCSLHHICWAVCSQSSWKQSFVYLHCLNGVRGGIKGAFTSWRG